MGNTDSDARTSLLQSTKLQLALDIQVRVSGSRVSNAARTYSKMVARPSARPDVVLAALAPRLERPRRLQPSGQDAAGGGTRLFRAALPSYPLNCRSPVYVRESSSGSLETVKWLWKPWAILAPHALAI